MTNAYLTIINSRLKDAKVRRYQCKLSEKKLNNSYMKRQTARVEQLELSYVVLAFFYH